MEKLLYEWKGVKDAEGDMWEREEGYTHRARWYETEDGHTIHIVLEDEEDEWDHYFQNGNALREAAEARWEQFLEDGRAYVPKEISES